MKSFVGVAGFEPAASCSQSRRDNRATLHPEMRVQIYSLYLNFKMIFNFFIGQNNFTFTKIYILLMRKYFYILLLLIGLISCTSKPSKETILNINGYWEIEKVSFPDGNKKEYQVNEFLDFISIKNLKGTRQKVAPQLDGTFLKGALQDKIRIVDSANCYFLKTKSKFTNWEEKIIFVSDDELVLENESKITYYYKKFMPYSKRK